MECERKKWNKVVNWTYTWRNGTVEFDKDDDDDDDDDDDGGGGGVVDEEDISGGVSPTVCLDPS